MPRGVLSLGEAAELSGMSKFDFGLEVGRRGIPRHDTDADLEADMAYARGSKTSLLSHLAVIGRLELMREQFGQVRVPPAVARELKALSLRTTQCAVT